MKIHIEIDTDNESTQDALDLLHGEDYMIVVNKLTNELRKLAKYDSTLSEDESAMVERIQTILNELIVEYLGPKSI